jgi:TPR repeat protein
MDEIAENIPVQWNRDRSMMAIRADQGDAEAMNEVALYFMSEDKYELAFPWFKLAAEKGHPDAQHWLSKCYFKGWGTDKNQALGLRWLGEAANNGHAIAQAQIQRFNIL